MHCMLNRLIIYIYIYIYIYMHNRCWTSLIIYLDGRDNAKYVSTVRSTKKNRSIYIKPHHFFTCVNRHVATPFLGATDGLWSSQTRSWGNPEPTVHYFYCKMTILVWNFPLKCTSRLLENTGADTCQTVTFICSL
jgi:hypothetical protein